MRLICRRQEGLVELFLSPLESLDRVLQRRALRHALQATKGLRNIQYGHIEEILRLIALGSPGDRLYLPGGVRVIRQYATVLITTRPPVRLAEHTLEVPGEVGLPEAGLRLRASLLEAPPPEWPNGRKKALLDAELLSPPLLVRSRRPGDFFYPAGFGRRKKLQDFFVDEKIPRDERDAVPVVLSGSDIVWLAGLRADERFRAREGTKRFVLLELGP
jgi:tRNA(Ile)-lysidine synthase